MATLVQTPESYLQVARKCMENALQMTSQSDSTSLQFNHAQCEYLANKLKTCVPRAEYWHWAQLNSSEFKSVLSSELNSECFEVMKLLCRTANEVESFIQGCRNAKWIQAALVLANMSLYASLLASKLNFCMLLFGLKVESNTLGEGRNWETQLDARDQRDLLTRLETMMRSSSDEECQTAKCLSGRLRQRLSGRSVQLEVWNVEFSSLRLVQRLGTGSAGVVNKSMWLTGQIEVAEKVFHGSDHPSFMNEVKILVGLAHPNIVPLLGYATTESSCSIIMELMDGDLFFLMQARLRMNHPCEFPFTIFEAVDMMLQTAEGMLYLHDNKVVHRDLISNNILVKCRNDIVAEHIYVKVADFGLSKTKESSSTYSNQTMNTGTTRWMAPELIPTGADEYPPVPTSDHVQQLRYPFKADVYSFGMVCSEILSGKVPFSTISTLRDVKKMVLNGDRPILPDQCPQALKNLIHSCWKSEPSTRPSFAKICDSLVLIFEIDVSILVK